MVLPDTSVWIPYFRTASGREGDRLEVLIDQGEVAICGPVFAELLGGAGNAERIAIVGTLGDLPWAELDPAGWHEVGVLARRLREQGQALPLTDLAIAVAAASSGHVLWTFDDDFGRIAAILEALDLYDEA